MTTVSINYQVFMTHCHQTNKSNSIGTDGLGPCVGIIATKKDGTIFCGHLACSIAATPGNQDSITSKAAAIMLAQAGTKDQVENVYCATSNIKDKSAKWMIDGITSTYSKVSYNEGNGIYWDKTKPIVTQFGTNLNGTTKGNQTDDGPMDVKN